MEEAVQLVEQHGGESTVLTLGPAEADEQLRYAASLGVDQGRAAADRPTADWDPQRTAAAITAAIADLEAADGPFDLILFGNESADSGNFQVGVRVAHALGRPIVNGIKGIEVDRATRCVPAARPTPVSRCTRVPMPAVLGVKEGINLPRYPTLKGRLGLEEGRRRPGRPARRARWPADDHACCRPPSRSVSHDHPRQRPRGRARRRRPARRTGGAEMTVLVVVEHDRGTLSPGNAGGARRCSHVGRAECTRSPSAPQPTGWSTRLGRPRRDARCIRRTTTCWPTTAPRRGARPSRKLVDSAAADGRAGHRHRPRQRGDGPRGRASSTCRWSPTASITPARRRRRGTSSASAGAARCSSAARSTAPIKLLTTVAPRVRGRRVAGRRHGRRR